ncbi:MAG: cache domain-containing protein [Angustibacter sp.]
MSAGVAGADGAERVLATAIGQAVAQVFRTVAEVRSAVLDCVDAADGSLDAQALRTAAVALLRRPGEVAVGLGLVAEAVGGGSPDRRARRVEWWQLDERGGEPRALRPDLKPTSTGYYDYSSAPWFDTPRRTGRRCVIGPYVDVHGTGRYLLTVTEPVALAGVFLGVAGADVLVSRFEAAVLRRLGPASAPFLVVSDEQRIVLSTTPRWPVGELISTPDVPGRPGTSVPDVPWIVHLPADG